MTSRIHSPQLTPRPQILLTAQGLIAESHSRAAVNGTLTMTAQRLRGVLVPVRAGDVITNLHVITTTTGTGAGYARMGLYNTALSQVAVTGDQNAAFTGAAGLLTCALTATYPVTADGVLYVVLLADLATTQPTVALAASNAVGAAATHTAVGSGTVGTLNQTAQASLPSTITSGGASSPIWFGIS